MRGLLGAVQFLTRVPFRLASPVPHRQVLPWLPVVGALIGAAIGGVAVGLGHLVPGPVAVTVAIVVGLLVTGAFHEDGLADVADAFGGATTRERRLEILKDSRHGTYGVAALCSSIVLRVVAAGSIVGDDSLFAGFVAAHALGRASAVAVVAFVPAASDGGLGAEASRSVRPLPTAASVAFAVGVGALLSGWWVGPLVLAAVAGSAVVVVLAWRKIGGVAGDVLGAVEQVVECLVLVVVSGLATR